MRAITTMLRPAAALLALLVTTSAIGGGELAPCPLDLSGKWCGTWNSCKDGHSGPLHASFCKIDDCHYRVRFHGRYHMVVPFIYGIDMTIVEQGPDHVVLSGCKRIPLYGTFECKAVATKCEFAATYTTSKCDVGEFKLCRK